ncbi:MAG: ribosome silencing factor [Bacteroidetes bacterium GWE2_29_8]|nr:MAG: ribosome silencing factor [Bacteroidetes bacterium GWE2_29_8]OFY15645.1 MAG: ribosome silencing factor [Bacteroidetes bacterium GWF2_29_10]
MRKNNQTIDNSELLIDTIVSSIEEKKGTNISILDLRSIEGTVSEYFVICEGNSKPHISALNDFILENVRAKLKVKPFHKEGQQNMEWVLIDYSSVIVHIFNNESRNFYNLEKLWEDAKITFIESSKQEVPNLNVYE